MTTYYNMDMIINKNNGFGVIKKDGIYYTGILENNVFHQFGAVINDDLIKKLDERFEKEKSV